MDQRFERYPDNAGVPKRDPALNMAKGAMFLSVLSLLSMVFVPVAMPLMLAPIAIVIALISRGGRTRLLPQAGIAVFLSTAAIMINLGLLTLTAYTMWRAVTDPAFREQLNAVLVQVDGRTLEELLAQYGAALP